MNRKGFFIPALAFAILVIFTIILVATFYPPVRNTIGYFLGIIFGK